MFLQPPVSAPLWAFDFARDIEANLDARSSGVPMAPMFLLNNLPDPASFWSTKTGMKRMGYIGVENATGGPTLCFSNGTVWIDVQTGIAVA